MKLLLLLTICTLCYSAEYLSTQQSVFHAKGKKPPYMSEKYRGGADLIYDCEDKHFACVWRESGEECKEKYKDDFALKKLVYRCRFLKRYEYDEQCQKKQKEFILQQKPGAIEKICSAPRDER